MLMDSNRVAGAFAYEREKGRFRIFKSNAVVLATGGVGRAYKITSNSWEYTGDGISLAYQAGAELIDMNPQPNVKANSEKFLKQLGAL